MQLSCILLFFMHGSYQTSLTGASAIFSIVASSVSLLDVSFSLLLYLKCFRDLKHTRPKAKKLFARDLGAKFLQSLPRALTALWLGAAVTALVVLAKTSTCSVQQLKMQWKSIALCIMPGVSAGVCISAWVSSCIVFGCTKISKFSEVEFEYATSYPCADDREMLASWTCDKSSINYPQAARVRTSTVGHRAVNSNSKARKVSWLPPLRFQLPSTPEEDLSQVVSPSRPLLSRSQTCTTASSSMYSQDTSRSGSNHSSTISYPSKRSSHRRSHSSKARSLLARNSTVPAKSNLNRHRSRSMHDRGKPIRPGTRPPMPPAEFWTYASKKRLDYDHSCKLESSKRHEHTYGARKREPSLCRYPLITPSNQPVYQTRRSTVHSETAHMHTVSYESLRKGEPCNIDEGYSTMSRGEDAQVVSSLKLGSHRGGSSVTRRHSRTLVKMRQPRCG